MEHKTYLIFHTQYESNKQICELEISRLSHIRAVTAHIQYDISLGVFLILLLLFEPMDP